MRSRHRIPRSVLGAVVAAQVAAASAVFALLPHGAVAATDFDVINGTSNAAAAFVVYFTGQFPNFSPGLVGSSFPLAHTHFDNSPFTEGTSSPADTGPAGGLVVSNYNTSPPPAPAPPTIAQPQYAEARFPGGSKAASFGNPPGPYAKATATQDGATAVSSIVDTTATQNPSSAAMRLAFNQAMSQWRARWMPRSATSSPLVISPLALSPLPSLAPAQAPAAADPSAPDGVDGDTSSTSVLLDPVKGLVTKADARIAQASFGGGALVLDGVHTSVTITNDGTPSATITTSVADASVGGVPVSIGSNGVTVGPQTVPLDQVQAASAALNGVLATAGIHVDAIAANVVQSDAEESVNATAVQVVVDNAGPPEQTVRYSLGMLFVDNLAMPSAPAVSLGGLGTFSASDTLTPPVSSDVSGPPAAFAAPPSVPSGNASAPASTPTPKAAPPLAPAAAQRAKPTWLLVTYLLWQTLIVATLASLWWWRSAARRLPLIGGAR